jgi:colanic acid biosynthesis protein WcaH
MIQTLPDDEFRTVVRATNLFALDLIIYDQEGKVLMGLRVNPPAQGLWFVPGGRVFKNESLSDALSRILINETGLTTNDVSGVSLYGLYEHIYDDNVFGDPSFNTHYIIAACRMSLTSGYSLRTDSQHGQFKFMSVEELLVNPLVHRFVKYYFDEQAPNKFY